MATGQALDRKLEQGLEVTQGQNDVFDHSITRTHCS